jgi:hypothetical protein
MMRVSVFFASSTASLQFRHHGMMKNWLHSPQSGEPQKEVVFHQTELRWWSPSSQLYAFRMNVGYKGGVYKE